MTLDELKDHLRQDHGIHEAPDAVIEPGQEASYGPDVSEDQLEELHRQHHTDNPDLLRHEHPDQPASS